MGYVRKNRAFCFLLRALDFLHQAHRKDTDLHRIDEPTGVSISEGLKAITLPSPVLILPQNDTVWRTSKPTKII